MEKGTSSMCVCVGRGWSIILLLKSETSLNSPSPPPTKTATLWYYCNGAVAFPGVLHLDAVMTLQQAMHENELTEFSTV